MHAPLQYAKMSNRFIIDYRYPVEMNVSRKIKWCITTLVNVPILIRVFIASNLIQYQLNIMMEFGLSNERRAMVHGTIQYM